jgi:DNA topoisomerase-1
VRPTSALRTPAQVAKILTDDERKLYDLIWKRAVACQMARPRSTPSPSTSGRRRRAQLPRQRHHRGEAGFLAVYEEGKDASRRGRRRRPQAAGHEARRPVPLDRIHADQHFTQPPPRFTEASLVKALEEYGIGRPSTYASIIQTLLFRKYVEMEGRSFRPTDVGRAVSEFPQLALHPLRRLRLHREARGRTRCGGRAARRTGSR